MDFSKVRQMHFAVSNNPDKKDALGKGFVIISEISGETSIPVPPWWKEYIPSIITAIAGLLTGLFVERKTTP